MTLVRAPMCLGCVHFDPDGLKCDAYQEGIPEAILTGDIDHRQPYGDDSGITFDPKDRGAAEYAASLFGVEMTQVRVTQLEYDDAGRVVKITEGPAA